MVVPDGSILRLGPRAEAEVDGITVSACGRLPRDPRRADVADDVEPSGVDVTSRQLAPGHRPPSRSWRRRSPPRRIRPDPTRRPPPSGRRRRERDPATTAVRPTTTVRGHRDDGRPAADLATRRAATRRQHVGASADNAAGAIDDEPSGHDPATFGHGDADRRSCTARRDGRIRWSPCRDRLAPGRGRHWLPGDRAAGCHRRREFMAARAGCRGHRAEPRNPPVQRHAIDGWCVELPSCRGRTQ